MCDTCVSIDNIITNRMFIGMPYIARVICPSIVAVLSIMALNFSEPRIRVKTSAAATSVKTIITPESIMPNVHCIIWNLL